MNEKDVISIVVIVIVVAISLVSIAGYLLLKSETGTQIKSLSTYALNARDLPWLENLVENEGSGVIVNEFGSSQLSEWGENGIYEKGIYQFNPNRHFAPSEATVVHQFVIRFKDTGGATKFYGNALSLYENILARQFLNEQGIEDVSPERLSATISQVLTSENLTFVITEDKGLIISVRDNFLTYYFGGAFVVLLQHSNLVNGLSFAFVDDIVPNITKNNAITIAQTAYEKMIS